MLFVCITAREFIFENIFTRKQNQNLCNSCCCLLTIVVVINILLQHPYEDPEGRIDLPASIKSQVDHWKRPVEFILEKVQKLKLW